MSTSSTIFGLDPHMPRSCQCKTHTFKVSCLLQNRFGHSRLAGFYDDGIKKYSCTEMLFYCGICAKTRDLKHFQAHVQGPFFVDAWYKVSLYKLFLLYNWVLIVIKIKTKLTVLDYCHAIFFIELLDEEECVADSANSSAIICK